MNKRYAMFPGSFDPITNGHVDIVKRLSLMYDKVYLVIADNRNKKALFSAEERTEFARNSLKGISNVIVIKWQGLIVDFARKYDVGIVIRGIRNTSDFEYEFEVSELNKKLCPELEFLFMPTSPDCALVRSSSIKELASFKADVSNMVSAEVYDALKQKYKG